MVFVHGLLSEHKLLVMVCARYYANVPGLLSNGYLLASAKLQVAGLGYGYLLLLRLYLWTQLCRLPAQLVTAPLTLT